MRVKINSLIPYELCAVLDFQVFIPPELLSSSLVSPETHLLCLLINRTASRIISPIFALRIVHEQGLNQLSAVNHDSSLN